MLDVQFDQTYPSRVDITRERLMDACVQAVGQFGIAQFKIKDVVEISGVSRQSVYNHYKNKQDLLRDTFAREGARISEASAEHLKLYPSLEDKFLQGFLFVYHFLPQNPLLKEFIDNNKEFFSYVDSEEYSVKDFGYLCLHHVFERYPQLSEDLAELTEYWARAVLSMIMLPSERALTDSELEHYVRERLMPGLRLEKYQIND